MINGAPRDSARPFRLWHAKNKHQLPGRNYSDERRAFIGALTLAYFEKVGVTIEVFDARNGKLLAQYTRKVASIGDWKEKGHG